MDQGSMVAIVRTLLYFMGKQNYMPTASDVLPILREALSAQALLAPPSDGGSKSAPIVWTSVGSSPASTSLGGTNMIGGPKQQRAR